MIPPKPFNENGRDCRHWGEVRKPPGQPPKPGPPFTGSQAGPRPPAGAPLRGGSPPALRPPLGPGSQGCAAIPLQGPLVPVWGLWPPVHHGWLPQVTERSGLPGGPRSRKGAAWRSALGCPGSRAGASADALVGKALDFRERSRNVAKSTQRGRAGLRGHRSHV